MDYDDRPAGRQPVVPDSMMAGRSSACVTAIMHEYRPERAATPKTGPKTKHDLTFSTLLF
jgi:hypothetical protein